MDENFAHVNARLDRADKDNLSRGEEIRSLAAQINLIAVTEDDATSITSQPGYQAAKQRTPAAKHDCPEDDDQGSSAPPEERISSLTRNQQATAQLKAADAIRTVETLRGRDDVGVEDFILSVRKARARCLEPELLLDLILIEKIIEHAKRNIRYIRIDSYEKLYECLRQHVSTPTTVGNSRTKLQSIRQGSTESVQSYNMRFRQQLNELLYATQNENKTPMERKIAISIEEREAVRTYILNLRREIGQIVTACDPTTLLRAQQLAADKEQWLRDANGATKRPLANNNPPPRRPAIPVTQQQTSSFRRPDMQTPPHLRTELKCTKCNRLGHTADRCYARNFPLGQQGKIPPRRVNKVEEEQSPLDETKEDCPESTVPAEDYSTSEQDYEEWETTDAYSWIQEQE
ncbi:uncharacterized protein LOC123988680 [Osmia bicornis bicornis]|uniref:uncharacterized protein LOC123987981 n=1 Tax=Osmia bicornis bicornis TaxID=1437191 RepID=UPI001EAEBEA8|nr:uncharacterized protein LOC123987981 [Osmia bicornis bicornis]XP_046145388.1 uncharacterized protein LOC123988680 [Osmia bicornis bicornis]